MKDYLKENIRFVMRTELLSGVGIARDLPQQLKNNSWNRVGLVIDKGLADNNQYVAEVINIMKKSLDTVVLVYCELPEPTYDYLDEVKKLFTDYDLNCFVGIGGGSTLDLTKGLATLKTNDGEAINYRGFGKVVKVPLPVVALPTTAGTGSEVTPYAVFIDTKDKWKFGINTEHNYPRLSLYDPLFLDSCTPGIYASAGMDAMTHTLESFVAKNATFYSRMYSRQAFRLLFINLKRIADGDRTAETKLNLLIGSGLAGVALMNSGAGPAGALSYPLGVYFDVPHGLAGSVFLPYVIRHNVEHGYTDYAELYDLVHDSSNLSKEKKSLIFADEIVQLCDNLGIPISLSGFGVVTEEDRKRIIDNAMQLKAAFEQNPINFGTDEITKVIYSMK
jgi:alcohol dehydrogenase class IV